MKKYYKFIFFWLLGGSIYYLFEIIFRGFSHWSMFILGGLCLVFFYYQGWLTFWKESLLRQTIRCVIFVTSMEFITGIIVNKYWGMDVWDYSEMPFQLFGQICLPFAIIFGGLSVMGIILSGYIAYWIFGEEKPHFYII